MIKPALLLSTLAAAIFSASAADTYTIDNAHSSVGFAVKHLMVTTTKGQFKDYTGTIQYDAKDISKSSVKVTIKTASINTDNNDRDNHLRSPDFFDATKNPDITFESTKIVKQGLGYEAAGKLTIKGVTKDVKIPFTINGPVKDPWGNTRIGVEGGLTINRQDFGVSWSKTLDNGNLVVANDVKIDLVIEGIQAKK